MLWNRSNYRQQTSDESHGTRQKNYTYFERNQQQHKIFEWVFSTLAYFEVTWSPQINLWGLRRTCSIAGGTNDYFCTPVKAEISEKVHIMRESINPPLKKFKSTSTFFWSSICIQRIGSRDPFSYSENKDIWPKYNNISPTYSLTGGKPLPQLPWGRINAEILDHKIWDCPGCNNSALEPLFPQKNKSRNNNEVDILGPYSKHSAQQKE